MPPLSRRRKQVQTPLSKSGQQKTGKPLVVYLACMLVAIMALYINIVLRTDIGQAMQSTSATNEKPGTDEKQASVIDRQLEPQKTQQTQPPTKPINTAKKTPYPILKQGATPHPKIPATGHDVTTLSIYSEANCKGTSKQRTVTSSHAEEWVHPEFFPQSARLQGTGMAQVWVGGAHNKWYIGAIMEVEGCADFYDLIDTKQRETHIVFILHAGNDQAHVVMAQPQVKPELQRQFATVQDLSKPHTRFIFSAESSEYFGYQVYANALGFLRSKQTDASWLRLLTSQFIDDLADKFPTFTAPRQLYSNFYHPINKADVIDKWMHSPDAPHPDDTLIVIDPDNWLINDINKWAQRASSKHALGQRAYYAGNKMLQELWQELCLNNCETKTDPAAVPYVIKASDMKEVAPLWRSYSIEIKERFKHNTTFKEKYGPGLGVRWAAEMFGYNAACTHLNIQTTIVTDMQIRDVDGGKRQFQRLNGKMPMIHMGRAWFPKDKPKVAAPWWHSTSNEPGSIAASGIQVWCKCNLTAPFVQPWPLPEGMDWVSMHTLTLLHDSVLPEHFGPIPINETFRKKKKIMYTWSHP